MEIYYHNFMLKFTATILQFAEQGEKTGWTYIEVPSDIAQKLKPGNKKAFRVQGKLDQHPIKAVALMPMGEGDFIMPLNAAIRKGIAKRKGSKLTVQIEVDDDPLPVSEQLMTCLEDEPEALKKFNALPMSHRNYYSNWIESAKTDNTKAKRIAMAINAMIKGWDFAQMLSAERAAKDILR